MVHKLIVRTGVAIIGLATLALAGCVVPPAYDQGCWNCGYYDGTYGTGYYSYAPTYGYPGYYSYYGPGYYYPGFYYPGYGALGYFGYYGGYYGHHGDRGDRGRPSFGADHGRIPRTLGGLGGVRGPARSQQHGPSRSSLGFRAPRAGAPAHGLNRSAPPRVLGRHGRP